MKASTRGLTSVSTSDLRRLLSAVFKEDIQTPLTIAELTRFGLQHCSGPLLEHLRALDSRAIGAVLVAVLAERAAAEERGARAK